jgi:hypothetical protein
LERDRRRTLSWGYDDDGSVTGMFRLPPEDAAVLMKAVECRMVSFEPNSADAKVDEGVLDPVGARRADALVEMAAADLDRREAGETCDFGDRYLVTVVAEAPLLDAAAPGAVPLAAGERAGGGQRGPIIEGRLVDPDPDRVPDDGGTSERAADAASPTGAEPLPEDGPSPESLPSSLEDSSEPVADEQAPDRSGPEDQSASEQGELCQLADGPGLAPSTVQAMMCDQPTVVITVDAAGNVLDVGRRSRRPNRAMQRALRFRDGGCRFPGCTAQRFQAHHLHYWGRNGATKLDNLASLCHRHHRRLHQGAFRVERGKGNELIFVLADGTRLMSVPPPPRPVTLGGELDPVPGAGGCRPDWDGGRLDAWTMGAMVDHLFGYDQVDCSSSSSLEGAPERDRGEPGDRDDPESGGSNHDPE